MMGRIPWAGETVATAAEPGTPLVSVRTWPVADQGLGAISSDVALGTGREASMILRHNTWRQRER